ncbi:MAG TPA: DUF4396 domain-containing protein [Streptosporangiaceae bacterium]|nr:DUF4396 domain-containing protein [Streptosporangiaceae bacterium]
MTPEWLTVVAWIYLSVCFCCAVVVAYDIVVNQRRQQMAIMNVVYPVTALYFGPIALAFYWRWARAPSRSAMTAMSGAMASVEVTAASSRGGDVTHGHGFGHGFGHGGGAAGAAESGGRDQPTASGARGRPRWAAMAIEVSHCGSGCALGDVVSEFAIFWLAVTIAGTTLLAEYAGDYVAALAFGILFQYFAIAPMRGLGVRDGLIAATKADFISLTAFEIGLFGWMAIMSYVLFPSPHQLATSSAAFWFLMQIGMIIGFVTSWPANVWLVRRGIKVPI